MPTITSNNLRLLRSGRVFKTSKRGVSAAAIHRIISAIVSKSDGQIGARVIREEVVQDNEPVGRLSFVVFRTESDPAFLSDVPQLRDVRHGCCAIFERGDYLLISTTQFKWSDKLAEKDLERLSRGEMQFYAANDCEAHESATLRSLDFTETAFRSQRVEGTDLSSSYPPMGANRQLLTALGVKKPVTDSTKVTLSTASVNTRGGRVGHRDWCLWAASVLDDVADGIGKQSASPFIGMFATPLDLKDLPEDVRPTGLLLWFDSMSSDIESGHIEFWWVGRGPAKQLIRVSSRRADAVMRAARASMRVAPGSRPKQLTVESPPLLGPVTLYANPKSYSLRSRWSGRVRVRDERTDDLVPLGSWLRRERCLHLVFSDLQYAYSDNTLFRDSMIKAHLAQVHAMLKPQSGFKETTPEKKYTNANKERFSKTSLFGKLEASFAGADALICDDLRGEWADYICVDRSSGGSATLSLVHAKGGSGTVAPAQFEVVVSQALKNLGRRHFTNEVLEARRGRWGSTVGNTSIQRIRRGGPLPKIEQTLMDVAQRFDTRVVVILAVTFLSEAAVVDLRDRVANGEQLDELESQLAWLLTSFMSTCKNVGVIPEIWCRP